MGRFQGFDSPLGGLKPIVYADWTASGRQLHFIEVFFLLFFLLLGLCLSSWGLFVCASQTVHSFIRLLNQNHSNHTPFPSLPPHPPQDFLRAEVMPFYGNTHTTTSITGMQTTLFRHEARQIIAGAGFLGWGGLYRVGVGVGGWVGAVSVWGVCVLWEWMWEDGWVKGREKGHICVSSHPVIPNSSHSRRQASPSRHGFGQRHTPVHPNPTAQSPGLSLTSTSPQPHAQISHTFILHSVSHSPQPTPQPHRIIHRVGECPRDGKGR